MNIGKIDQKWLMRLMILIIVTLSITAGYYYQIYELEYKRYKRLEDIYVRVRTQLGVDATQNLIDKSYQTEGSQ